MKEKISNFFNSKKVYLLTFMIATTIIGVLYKLNNTIPFGNNSLLCVDFYHQYGPMLGELYDRLHSFGGFNYSFTMAMGLPFFRNFLNYLSSPFNIIMLFFPRSGLLTSYSFIIGFKAVAAACTFVYFISKKFDYKGLPLIPLGLLYAFQGYFIAYYWNIMWLDGMVFLPIITLGIENIVNKQKWKLYTITLAIMLLANYFIGYMICIFSVVYFFFYNICKTKLKKGIIKENIKLFFKRFLMFGLSSLAAGALGAFLLLPMAQSMRSISATGGDIPTSQYYDFEAIDYLVGHFTGVDKTVFASDEVTQPNVSTGILSIALVLLFLINLDIPFKKKITYLLILGFFILAFFSPQLDYVLHAFHVPNDLPYRYSFIYSFIFLTIGAYSLINIRKIQYPLVTLSYLLLMVVMLLIVQEDIAVVSNNMMYINMILLTLYFIFYTSDHFLNKYHTLFYLAFIFIACVDVIVSVDYNWDITQVRDVFYEDYDDTKELLNYVDDYDNELFYRIENTSMMTLNDPSWYKYNGMTTFSSMAYENMAKLQHNLGMPGNEINSYYYVQSTPIYDIMFDMKYFIGVTNDTIRYQPIKTITETANEFKYNIGLAYGVNRDIKNWTSESFNPFVIENDFIEKASGIKEVLVPSTVIDSEEVFNDGNVMVMKYTYKNNGDNMYFYSDDYSFEFALIGDSLYYKNETYDPFLEENPDIYYSYLDDYNESNVINISSSEENVTLYIGFSNYSTVEFSMYEINHDKFEEAYNYLKNYKLDMTSFKEDMIEGNISLDKDMYVYTSIPYDNGWHVYVDGKEVETEKLDDTLLIFPCEAGTHTIRFEYHAPYMLLGSIISLSTLGIMIIGSKYGDKLKLYIDEKIFSKIKKKFPKKKKRKKEIKPKKEKTTTKKITSKKRSTIN